MNSTSDYVRSPQLLDVESSRLLIVDMQVRLLAVMPECEATIENCRKLITGAGILGVPVDATEQYPRGLGETVPELKALLGECPEKLRFSCAEVLHGVQSDVGDPDRRPQIVLAGIETHVCVLQTAFDLLSAGLEVFVVADAVQSRREHDYELALKRMADNGVHLVTTEMVLFEWCAVAGTDTFKEISRLVK